MHVTARMHLSCANERCQTQKAVYYMISFQWISGKGTTIGREICLWLPGYRSGGRSLKGNSPREHFQTNGTFSTFLLCWHLHNGMTSLVSQTVKRLSTMRETRVRSLGREVPWRRKCNPLQYYCLENPMDKGAW